MRTLSIAALLICFVSPAFAAEDDMHYSCIAQKTVGWETRNDGSNMIGQLKHDTKAFMVRYSPADTSRQKPKVPTIDYQARNGQTIHLSSDICEMSFLWNGDGPLPGIHWAMLCTDAIERLDKDPNREESFGEGFVKFSKSLAARPSVVSYVEAIVSPGGNSYLTEGECELTGLIPLNE